MAREGILPQHAVHQHREPILAHVDIAEGQVHLRVETLLHIAEPIIIGTGRTMPPRMTLALVEGWVAEARGSIPATSIPLEASCLDEAQRRRKSCLLHGGLHSLDIRGNCARGSCVLMRQNPLINSVQPGLHAKERGLPISHFTKS